MIRSNFKYKKIVLGGGGGDDPTDTIIVMVDDSQKPPKVEILHTSNKTTSDDIQANGSPNEEISRTTEDAKNQVESEEDKAEIILQKKLNMKICSRKYSISKFYKDFTKYV